jgi:hypothetical protein
MNTTNSPDNPQVCPHQVERGLRKLYRKLGRCPTTGGGVNRTVFKSALRLQYGYDEATAFAIIQRYTAKCGRTVTNQEIRRAIRRAGCADSGTYKAEPAWPEKNPSLVEQVIRGMPDLAGLRALSPVDGSCMTAGAIIDQLFKGDRKLCVAKSKERAITRKKSDLLGGMDRDQFVVPNSMTALFGVNQEGKRSARCLNNTGPKEFQIVESDPKKWEDLTDVERAPYSYKAAYIAAKKDEAAAVLWHLALTAPQFPFVMAVDSGGKSIHGWFHVAGKDPDEVRRFFRYAVALGADRNLWTPCQFVRMPNGTRDDGTRQTVVYFNPAAMEVQ